MRQLLVTLEGGPFSYKSLIIFIFLLCLFKANETYKELAPSCRVQRVLLPQISLAAYSFTVSLCTRDEPCRVFYALVT